MSEHTKTPWKLKLLYNWQNVQNGAGIMADDRYVALLNMPETDQPHQFNTDARLIVRAVNSHAELVEALKFLVEETASIYDMNNIVKHGENETQGMIAARALLAKVQP